MSAARELLTAFAADRQIADLAIDGEGRAGLKVDDKVQVDLKADGDRLYVYASLGRLPAANQVEVMTVLLAANRAGSLGEGPVMSIDPTLDDIVLTREVDARTAGAAGVLRAVGMMAEDVEAWSRQLGEIDAMLKDAPTPQEASQRVAAYILRA